jgi:hypothetical protein
MRILLIVTFVVLLFSAKLYAQNDFKSLDRQTYDYFIKGDYKNLKKTADLMLSNGIDYYYLRIRLGILEYNKQLYSNASKDLKKATEFNSLDTIAREYIYKCYLFSGRRADARLYLESISPDKITAGLKSLSAPVSSEFYVGSSVAAYDLVLYETNDLNYEAVKNIFSLSAGTETYFSARLKGTFAFTNYHKTGTIYSPSNSGGKDLDFNQDQLYVKLTGSIFPGWEISGFGHIIFYSEAITLGAPGNRFSKNQSTTEYLGGAGISKNGWKIRTSVNFSLSNFSNSNQIRGEGYITWLPYGNLNLYMTSAWMGQTDKKWGGSYQINQEIGLKILKSIWMESGIVNGNSFLYARNQGIMMNNSFQIPSATIYSNILLLIGNHFKISFMPFFTKNQTYSWDLNSYTITNKLNINSFGGSIKLLYKIR